MTFLATILDNSGAAGSCDLDGGTLTDSGYNLTESGDNCGLTGGNDLPNSHAHLGSLANNGGHTLTMALQANSDALDAVPFADCPGTDQRGMTRPDLNELYCDVGSFEYVDPPQAQTIHFTSPSQTTFYDGDNPFTVRATGGGSGKPVTFLIDPSSSSICTIGSSTNSQAQVTIIGVGDCTVDASQAAGPNYLAGHSSKTFSVNLGPVHLAYSGPTVLHSGKTVSVERNPHQRRRQPVTYRQCRDLHPLRRRHAPSGIMPRRHR